MIGSTLQLSLNRAKVSFLPCGTNEKFINLCRIAGPVSYFNCQNLPARNKNGKRSGTLTVFTHEILSFNFTTRNKWIKVVIRELKAMKNPTHVLQQYLLFQGNRGLTLLLCFQLHGWISSKEVRKKNKKTSFFHAVVEECPNIDSIRARGFIQQLYWKFFFIATIL